MPEGQLGPLVRHLRRLVGGQLAGGLTDGQLLERWLALRDEAAFEVLVWRHGPIVLGVCGRMLAGRQDIEDAFQATMLILLRKAGSISKRESIGSWLYKVANRVCLRARTRAAQMTTRERHGVDLALLATEPGPDRDGIQAVFDEEINKLPAKYRAVFVLCYLEGKTNEEAARELRCPVGTVFSRLDSARKRLRSRLESRGVSATTDLMADTAAAKEAPAILPPAFIDATIKACLAWERGQAPKAAISAAATKLVEGVFQTMFISKIKVAAGVVLAVAALGTGAGALRYAVFASDRPQAAVAALADQPAQQAPAKQKQPAPAPQAAKAEHIYIEVPSPHDGILHFVGAPLDGVGLGKFGGGGGPGMKSMMPMMGKRPGDESPALKFGGGGGPGMKSMMPMMGKRPGDESPALKYRRWRVGEKVERAQVLAQLDTRLIEDNVRIAQAKVIAAEADLMASEKTRDEAKQRFQTQQDLLKAGRTATSQEDLRSAKLTHDRFVYEVKSKQAAVEVAKLEVKRAETVLDTYTIRSPATGVIRTIDKHTGEGVKYLERVVVIETTDEAD